MILPIILQFNIKHEPQTSHGHMQSERGVLQVLKREPVQIEDNNSNTKKKDACKKLNERRNKVG